MKRAAIALSLSLSLTGCAGFLGPGGWVASNQVGLQNFLLVAGVIATGEAVYLSTQTILRQIDAQNAAPVAPPAQAAP